MTEVFFAIYFYLCSTLLVATIIFERWTSLTEITIKDALVIVGAPLCWPVLLVIAIYRTITQ